MRKIMVEAEVSVDGAMGGENVDFWNQVFPFHSADVQEYLDDLLFMPDALLMGQKTYEFFAQVWPTRQGKQADKINSMPKYVASRTLEEPLQWNAKLIKGDVAEEIRKLKGCVAPERQRSSRDVEQRVPPGPGACRTSASLDRI